MSDTRTCLTIILAANTHTNTYTHAMTEALTRDFISTVRPQEGRSPGSHPGLATGPAHGARTLPGAGPGQAKQG